MVCVYKGVDIRHKECDDKSSILHAAFPRPLPVINSFDDDLSFRVSADLYNYSALSLKFSRPRYPRGRGLLRPPSKAEVESLVLVGEELGLNAELVKHGCVEVTACGVLLGVVAEFVGVAVEFAFHSRRHQMEKPLMWWSRPLPCMGVRPAAQTTRVSSSMPLCLGSE